MKKVSKKELKVCADILTRLLVDNKVEAVIAKDHPLISRLGTNYSLHSIIDVFVNGPCLDIWVQKKAFYKPKTKKGAKK